MKAKVLFQFTNLAMAILIFTILGCENKSIDQVTPKTISQISYIYKGETLLVKYTENNDVYAVINNEIGDKIKAILDGPTAVTYIELSNPDLIYLFDSDIECNEFMKATNKTQQKPASNGRSEGSMGSWSGWCFEHDNFVGYSFQIYPGFVVSNLATWNGGWDNYISSFYIESDGGYNVNTFDFYENPGFSGKLLRVMVDNDSQFYADLDKARYGGIFGNKWGWNDKISSIICY